MPQSVRTKIKKVSSYLCSPEPLKYAHSEPVKDDGRLTPNGLEIKCLRKLRGLTQEDLALQTGITVKTIRNLENNEKYRCTAETINTLASFFRADTQTLINMGDTLKTRLLTSTQDIIEENMQIATSARKVLACVGSRARDPNYLQRIEATLAEHPKLIHYRTMALPPFKQIFQEHLVKLLKIRDPHCRAQGHKSLHIGIYNDTLKQSEFSFCANEKAVLIVLPSMSGFAEYNTALLIQNAAMAEKYISQAKILYQMGRPLETEQDIRQLGLVKSGEQYV